MVLDEKLCPSLNCQCHVPPDKHRKFLVFKFHVTNVFRIEVCVAYLPDNLRQPTARLSPWYCLLSCKIVICNLECITGDIKESVGHQHLDMTLKGSGKQKSLEETTT